MADVDAAGEPTTRFERSVIFPLPVVIAERHVTSSASDHRMRVTKTVLRYVPQSAFPDASTMTVQERQALARTITLDAGDWRDTTWPDDLPELVQWSDSPQGKSKLREALREVSKGLTVTVSSSGETGWVLTDEGWAYVTSRGALSARGVVANHSGVSGDLATFLKAWDMSDCLGAIPTEADVDDAFAMLQVMPPRYGVPALGTALWSIVAGKRIGSTDELDPSSGLVLVLGGQSASGKSLMSAAMWSLFATGITADELPGPQGAPKATTTVGLQKWFSSALGCPATLDDLSPESGAVARERLAESVRAIFNRQSSMKGTRTGGLATPRMMRATAVISVEDAVMGQSIRNRSLYIPFVRGQIDAARLASWQTSDAGRRRAVAGFIAWVASRRLEVADEVQALEARFWAQIQSAVAPTHPLFGDASRVARQHARALTGLTMFLRWAVASGAWHVDDAAVTLPEVWQGQFEAFRAQMMSFAEGSDASQIRRAIALALDSGRGHIATTMQTKPLNRMQALGWHGDSGHESPRGALLGWTDDSMVWLSPDATAAVVRETSAMNGAPLNMTSDAVGKALAAAGLLGSTDSGRNTARAPHVRRHGWPVSVAWLLGETDDDDTGGGGEWVDPGPPSMDWPTQGVPMIPAPAAAPVVIETPGPMPAPVIEPAPVVAPEPAATAPETVSEPVAAPVAPAPVSTPHTPVVVAQDVEPKPAPMPTKAAAPKGRPRRDSGQLGTGMDVAAEEIREAMRWAEEEGPGKITAAQAQAVVERWHDATGTEWNGTHAVIRALLTGHTRWPGAKTPRVADLSLFKELLKTDQFWTARSWTVTPGAPADESTCVAADVNAQFVAAASSVELGEGDPEHWEPGEVLPDDTLKRPGWVRLKRAVKDAPHGLDLPSGMWIPTPLAMYLTRDCGLKVSYVEALIWPERRKALGSLAGHFRDWRSALSKDTSPEGRMALSMLKITYAKALGGYLSSERGLTPREWARPDWAMLLKAQAEANCLRAVDKLPEGVIVRSKFADSLYLELPEGVDLSAWPNLDPVQPGKFKLSDEYSALEFAECDSPGAWREVMASLKGGE
ncbi:hypothetical protein ACX31A_09630 [Dermacoccus nishinomiyaensis]